jgi:hypothetical protein
MTRGVEPTPKGADLPPCSEGWEERSDVQLTLVQGTSVDAASGVLTGVRGGHTERGFLDRRLKINRPPLKATPFQGIPKALLWLAPLCGAGQR